MLIGGLGPQVPLGTGPALFASNLKHLAELAVKIFFFKTPENFGRLAS